MNIAEFHKEIASGVPAPVYLFCPHKGPKVSTYEPMLAEQAVQAAIERFVEPSMRDLCFTMYYADESDPREVVNNALTVPFLTERRVIVVHRADHYQFETVGKPILSYIETPSDTTLMLLVATQIDRRLKLFKVCERAGRIVECPELKEDEVLKWARREIEARGKTIQTAALQQLFARTGKHLSDVRNAVEIICNYIGERESIEEKDVEAACSDVDEEEVWALTDAIAASNTTKAIRVLRELIEPNKNEFQILGSINWLLRTAYGVAAGGEAGASINRFAADKVKPLATKLGLAKFRDAFALCIETDLLFRSTGVDRSLALELLVIKLAAPRNRPA